MADDGNMPTPRYSVWQAVGAALALAQRAIDEVRTLAARPPTVGPAGKDGMGFDDLTIEHDGERTFIFCLTKGDQRREYTFKVPMPIYRELWLVEQSYEKGDMVTWGGSLWSALTETNSQPGASHDWKLAAKRGRDGRNTETVKLIPPVSIKKPDEPGKD